jgi:hypothetical protein
VGKCIARVPPERWIKAEKITSSLVAVAGVLFLIAAASVGHLWLYIINGCLFVIGAAFGLLAAFRPRPVFAFVVRPVLPLNAL